MDPSYFGFGSTPVTAKLFGRGFTPTTHLVFTRYSDSRQWILPVNYVNSEYATVTITAAMMDTASNVWAAVNDAAIPIVMSNRVDIFIRGPSILSLTPHRVDPGGPAFDLAVSGECFAPTSVVRWNEGPLATTYIDGRNLKAAVPASLIAQTGTAYVTVTTGAFASNVVAFQLNSSPEIKEISPTSVNAGGPAFTLTVTSLKPYYVPGSIVEFGGMSLATTFHSATRLSATVPSSLTSVAGRRNIAVKNPDGQYSAGDVYFYVRPYLQLITPREAGVNSPDLRATISGAGFQPGCTVILRNSSASYSMPPTELVTDQIKVTIPYAALTVPGPADVWIDCVWTTSLVATNAFTVGVPEISSVTPDTVPVKGSTSSLTIRGRYFMPFSVVKWADTFISQTFISTNELLATVPPSLLTQEGSYPITVLNLAVASQPRSVTVGPALTISSVSHGGVDAGGPDFDLTLHGAGFVSGSEVQWKGTALTTTFFPEGKLVARVPAAQTALAGTYPISVRNPNGVVSTQSLYVIVNPVLRSVSPSQSAYGGNPLAVTLAGAGFTSSCQLEVHPEAGGLWTASSSNVTAGSLVATIPGVALQYQGPLHLSIVDSTGGRSGKVYLAVSGPQASALNPSFAAAGSAGVTLTVTGSWFAPSSVVKWNGAALATTYISATELRAQVSPALLASPGQASVAVSTSTAASGEVNSGSLSFTIQNPPSISGVSPDAIDAGSAAVTLAVSGTNFQASSVVQWNGAALATTFQSATSLRATAPAGLLTQSGAFNVTVASPGGVTSNAFSVRVSPVLQSVNPDSVAAGSPATPITAGGAGLNSSHTLRLSGAGKQWALSTAFVSSTTLQAIVPADALASEMNAEVQLLENGSVLRSVPFTVTPAAPPLLTALSPDRATAGDPRLTLAVTGTGFCSDCAVQWNGARLESTFVNATRMTAVVPAALLEKAGSAYVTVFHPRTAASNGMYFTIAAKIVTLTSISPQSVEAGSAAFTLTVTGTGFESTSLVLWNGTGLTTTFVSATQLTAAVPAGLVATAGTVSIIVGPVSNPLTLTIGKPKPAVLSGGVVNAFSSLPGIAPGAAISIYGRNFASEGSTVLINGLNAPVLFAGTTQINAQVPFEVAPGSATLTVEANGVRSDPVTLAITATAPGILTYAGSTQAIAQNVPGYALNSQQSPVAPGDYLILYLTGQGAVDPPVATGAPAPGSPLAHTVAPVEVRIGGVNANVAFAGLTPGFVGLMQVNLLVPALPSGNHAIALTVGGGAANAASVWVQAH